MGTGKKSKFSKSKRKLRDVGVHETHVKGMKKTSVTKLLSFDLAIGKRFLRVVVSIEPINQIMGQLLRGFLFVYDTWVMASIHGTRCNFTIHKV